MPQPTYRIQMLLAALLLDPRSRRRDQLAGILFPDAPEDRARHRLSHTLWQARQWLPEVPVETTPTAISMPAGSVWVDVAAFNEAAGSERPGRWLEALALYRGDLMEGCYEDWLLEERELAYLSYVRLSHRVCDELWRRGDAEGMLPVAERLVQREPFDERALRALVRAYLQLGRRGAALAAYDRCVAQLQDEAGAEPEPATLALGEALQLAVPSCQAQHLLGTEGSTDEPTPLAGGNAPIASLSEARRALIQGAAHRAEECLAELSDSADCSPRDVRLLQIDVALFLEEYDQARALLQGWSRAEMGPEELLRAAKLAVAMHEVDHAKLLASEALVAPTGGSAEAPATDTAGTVTHIEALLVLARAQQTSGDRGHAAQSFERARELSRSIGYHHGVAEALLIDGHGRLRQGRYGSAGAAFREAQALALEHDLRYDLANALQGLRTVLANTNHLSEALATAQEELSLWRDLTLTRREAATLEGIATIQNHLGRSAESLRTMGQARSLSDRIGDPARIAENRYQLVCAMVYHDDALAGEALRIARQALTAHRGRVGQAWAARMLEIMGYALWVDGQYAPALETLNQAEAATRTLGELAYLPELLAYRGLARVGLGDHKEGLSLTRQAMLLLAQGGVSDEVVPEILYAHAVALDASGNSAEAGGLLRRTYDLLLNAAATFDDAAARQAYFRRNPTMRRLMGLLERVGIAPAPDAITHSVTLPAALGGGRRRIEWTIDAGPADEALMQAEGRVALRRARLARMLGEATAQGAAPTVADLAQALDVSERTVQRDLAALRAVAPHT